MGTFNVSLKTLTDRVSMEVVYTPRELDEISVEIAEVNRPGLFLAGYYDYFDKLRLQIMGLAEMNFLSGLTAEKRYEALELWITAVTHRPRKKPLRGLSVSLLRIFCSWPPACFSSALPMMSIPNKNRDRPPSSEKTLKMVISVFLTLI